jgi:superfamily II DNA or RNA helicase
MNDVHVGAVVTGPLLPEPVEVIALVPMGESVKLIGKGLKTWQDRDQVVTSISWVSRIEDAKESLLRSRWDLVVVDEAHTMSAYDDDRKTLAYTGSARPSRA